MNATQLNLGYQYTFSNDNIDIRLTKDSNIYFIKGFDANNKYINLSFTTFAPAKKEFKRLIKTVQN